VSYYGGRSVPFLHERLGAPMLFHFGERDSIIPPEHVAKTRAAYPDAEHHVYAAGHGFNCDQRKDYDAGSAALARERTLAFFDRVL
jgi:carboxymethylenebutenolidase